MDITSELADAVKLCGDPVQLPDKVFSSIIDRVLKDVLNSGPNRTELRKDLKEAFHAEDAKHFYNSLLEFTLEAAKSGSDKAMISSRLEEYHWGPDRISFYVDKFEESRCQLEVALDRIGTSYPHVVDARWRLDYYIKDNFVEKVNKPTYLISLRTQHSGQRCLNGLEFACSEEQLQDLVTKLRDATKTLEKAAQM